MQNQNIHPWTWGQGSAPTFPGGQPILPSGFPSAGVEQTSVLPGYHQIYGNNPVQPPTDYGQWTSTQLQQWQQWQQWQEKYQQWQAQYGKKYAESLAAIGQSSNFLVPGVPPVVGVPKPVKPATDVPAPNPPLPTISQPVPPPPPEEEKPPPPVMNKEAKDGIENGSKDVQEEELSEAEKTFDIQFKQWEAQFNAWKKENQDHPDKAQYKEYEKKWETWREQLLQRREQMRKKRLSQVAEHTNDSSSEKREDSKPKSEIAADPIQSQSKPAESEYCYRTQPLPQTSFTTEPPKFEAKPLFDKPPPVAPTAAINKNFPNSSQLPFSGGFGDFSEKIDPNRPPPFLSNRNQVSLGGGNFEGKGGSNFRFGNFEGEGNFRFRNSNQNDGPRFGGDVTGNSGVKFGDNYPSRRFDDRSRFPLDNYRNERDFGQQRFSDNKDIPNRNESENSKPSQVLQKPKVPSLFDITVEKPVGFMDTKPKIWEKDFDSQKDRDPWGNSRMKNAPSPWIQPWEIKKIASQKAQEQRPWDRGEGFKDNNSPWLKDISGKQDIDKAELSGYVGNILAKLGHFNVVPPILEANAQDRTNKKVIEVVNLEKEESSNVSSCDSSNVKNQMKKSGENQDSGGGLVVNCGEISKTNDLDRFDESSQQSSQIMEEKLFRSEDIDERIIRRDDKLNFGDRDEVRNFNLPTSRDNRRLDDRWRGRDERAFGGRFNDIDERFGMIRDGRRGFDRFDRDDRLFHGTPRGVTNPFDRFGRNEPVWKPQIFDYSQGRPLRVSDPEDSFKISTVVDYSHGENKQTFDYGHGEPASEKTGMKSFDYGHGADAPTVIDYGHGVDKDSGLKDFRKDKIDIDGGKSDVQLRSPKGQFRSRSRSPLSRFKRNSMSPPFKSDRGRGGRGGLGGRQMMRRGGKRVSDEKLSPGDGDVSKHSFDVTTVLVEDLICSPGRDSRPNKLVFIMRGIPGSGKTYVTKLIKDKEIEFGGDPPRILSLDDYFMTEVEKETVDEESGRKVKTKVMEYEYEAAAEPHYKGSLVKAFKKTISDGFFSFVIVDSVNEKTKDYEEMWSFAKQKGFQVYIAEMDNDVTVCTARNIHKRIEKEISDLVKVWEETPQHYLRLDVRSLLQSDAITEVEMEVVSDTELEKTIGVDGEDSDDMEEEKGRDKKKNDGEGEEKREAEDKDEEEDEDEPGVSTFVKSRWDQFENSEQNLDRLDGLKRRREGFHATMEDYLQLPDDVVDLGRESVPGKKRVRWADLEERRQQEKMRAIGFVVGQTDWSRMTDPTFGESALTRTKYI